MIDLAEPGPVTLASAIEEARAAERVGALDDALRWYECAYRRVPGEGSAAQAAELLRRIGSVHRQRGELELAMVAYETSLAIAVAYTQNRHIAREPKSHELIVQMRGRGGKAT